MPISLSLGAKEQASMSLCGCRLSRAGNSVTLERCGTHEAALDLVTACRVAQHFIATNAPALTGMPHLNNAYEALHAAIKLAERR